MYSNVSSSFDSWRLNHRHHDACCCHQCAGFCMTWRYSQRYLLSQCSWSLSEHRRDVGHRHHDACCCHQCAGFCMTWRYSQRYLLSQCSWSLSEHRRDVGHRHHDVCCCHQCAGFCMTWRYSQRYLLSQCSWSLSEHRRDVGHRHQGQHRRDAGRHHQGHASAIRLDSRDAHFHHSVRSPASGWWPQLTVQQPAGDSRRRAPKPADIAPGQHRRRHRVPASHCREQLCAAVPRARAGTRWQSSYTHPAPAAAKGAAVETGCAAHYGSPSRPIAAAISASKAGDRSCASAHSTGPVAESSPGACPCHGSTARSASTGEKASMRYGAAEAAVRPGRWGLWLGGRLGRHGQCQVVTGTGMCVAARFPLDAHVPGCVAVITLPVVHPQPALYMCQTTISWSGLVGGMCGWGWLVIDMIGQ